MILPLPLLFLKDFKRIEEINYLSEISLPALFFFHKMYSGFLPIFPINSVFLSIKI